MKKILYWSVTTLYFLICYFVFFTEYVYAYIDPSAVTYVIQAVAGVFIAIGACLTIFRHKIFSFFNKNKKADEKKEIHFVDETEDESINT